MPFRKIFDPPACCSMSSATSQWTHQATSSSLSLLTHSSLMTLFTLSTVLAELLHRPACHASSLLRSMTKYALLFHHKLHTPALGFSNVCAAHMLSEPII